MVQAHRVVVTGMGVATAIASDIPTFTQALKNGSCGVSADKADALGVAARLGELSFPGCLSGLALSDELLKRARRVGTRQPRSAQAALWTALEAWASADMEQAGYSSDEVSLVLSGHNIAQADQFRAFQKYQERPEYLPASYALHFMDTNILGVISEALGLHGEGFGVGAASASGNVGLLHGYWQVRYGLCKACIVVAGMADLSPVEIQAFRNIGALGGKRFAAEPLEACRPFDEEREGFIYGQGSASLILENAETAAARGAGRWGEIAGGALCLDGNRLSDPSVEGEARAMRKALGAAGMTPEDVSYVNAHATSSIIGDQVEIDALAAVFGSGLARIWVNATKGLIGHCLYASGLVEAVATLIQMREGFLHPNRNLARPIASPCRFVGATLQEASCDVAINNAFGFGGLNSCIVFRK